MNSFFQSCHYCGISRPMNELEHIGNGFITCKDATECLKRAGDKKHALLIAKLELFKKNEQERTNLLLEIQSLTEELGIPDTALIEHQTEMARMNADEEC